MMFGGNVDCGRPVTVGLEIEWCFGGLEFEDDGGSGDKAKGQNQGQEVVRSVSMRTL